MSYHVRAAGTRADASRTAPVRHLVLSPHYDDAALSLGGTIHALVQSGQQVWVVTVFAGGPPPGLSLSRVARKLHQRMGQSGDALLRTRQAEDRAALQLLGASSLWLSPRDAIYRRDPDSGAWCYPRPGRLFGAIHPLDLQALPALLSELDERAEAADRSWSIYAPLGIGGHVDHQLARALGERMAERGQSVSFYEDFPYAEPGRQGRGSRAGASMGQGPDGQLASPTTGLQPRLRSLTAVDLDARVESVLAYRSQLAHLLGDAQQAERRVRQFAETRGADGPAERTWHRP